MIVSFWLLANGEKAKALQAPKEAQSMPIQVGMRDSNGQLQDVVAVIRRDEIDSYLTDEFFRQYNVFEKYLKGFGLPGGKSWDQQPLFIMRIIETFQDEYMKLPKEVRKWQ